MTQSEPQREGVDPLIDLLQTHDAGLTSLSCRGGSVLLCPGLQGRIFCRIDGELVHRLDIAALVSPSLTSFNNLGGNSLWPAPEGGPFAFNYLPGSDHWLVQQGIAEAPARIVSTDADRAAMEKQIHLTNRHSIEIEIRYRRAVSVQASSQPAEEYGLAGLTYRVEDTFVPMDSYRTEEVLLAPWSLEQFPGAEGVTIFCKAAHPENAVNDDFYGVPEGRITHGPGHFTFRLGGEDRHQIGVKKESEPEFIGALDVNRSMLMLRRTQPQDGVYFNIADNDQPRGPYSAADIYSVFNGGALNFFELETIGAMQCANGCVATSTLVSETTLLKGRLGELRRYIAEQLGLRLAETPA